MSRQVQEASVGRPVFPPDRRRHPELSDRERDFWRRAVALERQRLELAVCAPHAWDVMELH